jgi:pantoate--beta-alanine ligase
MVICRTIEELKRELTRLEAGSRVVGFVPTMGYLHEGHASLLRAAREQTDIVVLSVFVNPLQFGPQEDLDRYPRNEEGDIAVAEQCGADIVFMPSVGEMYPQQPLTSVKIGELTNRLCGASRPGHFDGVGTVVSKLFHLVKPNKAYFGMKDAQQVAVIEQMVRDLNIDVEIVRCPTLREPDGLALSSRNVYLSADLRRQAVVLFQALELADGWIKDESIRAGELVRMVEGHIAGAKDARIDYVELLWYPSLLDLPPDKPLSGLEGTVILAMAVKFGDTRLIDNRLYDLSGGE